MVLKPSHAKGSPGDPDSGQILGHRSGWSLRVSVPLTSSQVMLRLLVPRLHSEWQGNWPRNIPWQVDTSAQACICHQTPSHGAASGERATGCSDAVPAVALTAVPRVGFWAGEAQVSQGGHPVSASSREAEHAARFLLRGGESVGQFPLIRVARRSAYQTGPQGHLTHLLSSSEPFATECLSGT